MNVRSALFFLVLSSAASAAPRTWTDAKGRTIEAEFVSQTADRATVRLATGKDVILVKTQLSAADQEFLKTAAAAPAAVQATAPAGRATFTGQTFDSARIDKSKWNRPSPPRDFKMKSVEFPGQIETEHFLIAGCPSVKPALLEVNAECCERTYAHMVRLLPRLGEIFLERRMALWITGNSDDMSAFGSWLNSHPDGQLGGSPTTSNAGTTLPKDFAAAQKLMVDARTIRTDSGGNHRSLKHGSRIFFIAGNSFYHAVRDLKFTDGNSLGLLELGWNYFMESEICGNITTEVSFSNSSSTVEGFRNGRTWPAAVKAVLKNGGTKPSAALLLKTKKIEAQPIHVGLAFGFCHWTLRDPARARQFNDMLSAAITAGTAPTPEEFIKAFGFADNAAFEKAFTDYLMSDRFK